jgi:hypothetical protein
MLAMPERAKVFAQFRRAAAMPTFARLFTRETPRRCVQKRRNDRCRPVVEAGVVGCSDPPLRAVEEPLRLRAQLSRDLDTERDELRAIGY